jgi:hypothetical protein
VSNKVKIPIEDDPAIKNLLARMPESIKNSFSEDQLYHLRNAVASRQWGSHTVDYRTTFKIFTRRYYLVFLMGHNIRVISRGQIKRQLLLNALLVSVFICFSIVIGLTILYLIKSALGIDLFEDFSLGIWTWFKS